MPPSHPSAWKVCSTNFALTKLSEGRMALVLHNTSGGVLAWLDRSILDY